MRRFKGRKRRKTQSIRSICIGLVNQGFFVGAFGNVIMSYAASGAIGITFGFVRQGTDRF
jgi:hypothetical protein